MVFLRRTALNLLLLLLFLLLRHFIGQAPLHDVLRRPFLLCAWRSLHPPYTPVAALQHNRFVESTPVIYSRALLILSAVGISVDAPSFEDSVIR